MLADRAAVIDSYTNTSGDLTLKTEEELANALSEIQQFKADLQELEGRILGEQLVHPAVEVIPE